MTEKIFPYPLPENWHWTTLEKVCEFERGITFPASAKEIKSTEKNIPCVRTANVQTELDISDLIYVDKYYTKNNPLKFLKVGDIVMSSANSKDLVGKTCYVEVVPFEMTFGGFVLVIRTKEVFNKYLFYFLRCEFLFGKFMENSKQTVNIANISNEKLKKFPIPLPPLDEQKKIVERIESLFSKLDAAKSIVQKILSGYELRRAAILHKASTGELSKNFRAENNLSLDDWQEKNFFEICDIVRGGSPRPAGDPKYYGGSIPFLKVADITNNSSPYIYSAKYTIKKAGLTKTRMVKADTLLLTNSGATLGVPAISKIDTALNDGIAAFLNLDSENLMFYYYFWSMKTQEMRGINKGAAQPNLNTNIIGAVKINLPPLAEQKEIVRVLDSLLDKEQRTKEIAEKTLHDIDLMKKSILARAFRGEL